MLLLLLAAMLGIVFLVSWTLVNAWVAAALAVVTLLSGAILGMSTDLDE